MDDSTDSLLAFAPHADYVSAMLWRPDCRLFSCSYDGSIRILDPHAGEPAASCGLRLNPKQVAHKEAWARPPLTTCSDLHGKPPRPAHEQPPAAGSWHQAASVRVRVGSHVRPVRGSGDSHWAVAACCSQACSSTSRSLACVMMGQQARALHWTS